jgi:hypothetical protein
MSTPNNQFIMQTRRKIMKANAQTEVAVLGVLDKFMETYKRRDIEGMMSLLPSDDDLFLFGTGMDEKRTGRDEFKLQAERDWSQTEALAFNFTWHRVSAAGPVTSVLEQRGDDWFLVQAHVSLPAPAQEEGDSVPV